jgi:hypothetical protein
MGDRGRRERAGEVDDGRAKARKRCGVRRVDVAPERQKQIDPGPSLSSFLSFCGSPPPLTLRAPAARHPSRTSCALAARRLCDPELPRLIVCAPQFLSLFATHAHPLLETLFEGISRSSSHTLPASDTAVLTPLQARRC